MKSICSRLLLAFTFSLVVACLPAKNKSGSSPKKASEITAQKYSNLPALNKKDPISEEEFLRKSRSLFMVGNSLNPSTFVSEIEPLFLEYAKGLALEEPGDLKLTRSGAAVAEAMSPSVSRNAPATKPDLSKSARQFPKSKSWNPSSDGSSGIVSNNIRNLNIPKTRTGEGSDVLVPKDQVTRFLTGDVQPGWIQGLGRGSMVEGKWVPAEGYADVFVTSLAEYRRIGIDFKADGVNDPIALARKLDLHPDDLEKVKENGGWLMVMNPGRPVATPTGRESQWNPLYKEGGFTGSGVREWVTPNRYVPDEINDGLMKLYKIEPDGRTVEYSAWQGQVVPKADKGRLIDEHIKSSKNDAE